MLRQPFVDNLRAGIQTWAAALPQTSLSNFQAAVMLGGHDVDPRLVEPCIFDKGKLGGSVCYQSH